MAVAMQQQGRGEARYPGAGNGDGSLRHERVTPLLPAPPSA
jgi:hypothetical protein